MEPFSTHLLKRVLATDPTILYFSMRIEVEMCFPSLGIPAMILS